MNYEKEYKRIVGKIKNAYLYAQTDSTKAVLEEIIPELKESEDEKVRKAIMALIEWSKSYSASGITNDDAKKMLAWLEKQGKQKQLYIRFGEIPTDEKSKIYRGEIEVGTENGVSVYPAFKTDEGDIVLGLSLPITKTTLYTQQHLIEYDNRPCYLVNGDYIGKDTDGQPLINNVSIIKKIDSYRVKEENQTEQEKDILEDVILDGNEDGLIAETIRYKNEKQGENKASYTTIVKTGDGGVNALVARELPTDGEQNPTDKVEPKFKVGDWLIFNERHNSVYQVERIDNYRYYLRHYLGGTMSVHFDNELVRLWTLQDTKSGDVLATKAGGIFIYKKLLYDKPFAYCGIDKFGVFKDCNCGNGLDWTPYLSDVTPATKEQRDTLHKAMADAGYTFDFEKKELKKIEQKTKENNRNVGVISANWSEEDKDFMYDTLSNLTELKDRYGEGYGNVGKCIDWLKSLKDRVQPQPKQEWNEEEIEPIISDYLCGREHYGGMIGRLCHLKPKQKQTEWGEDDKAFLDDILCKLEHDLILNKDEKDWLKSLRPQSQWKPSELQLECLSDAIEYYNSLGYPAPKLKELLDDLKKLKGEV